MRLRLRLPEYAAIANAWLGDYSLLAAQTGSILVNFVAGMDRIICDDNVDRGAGCQPEGRITPFTFFTHSIFYGSGSSRATPGPKKLSFLPHCRHPEQR